MKAPHQVSIAIALGFLHKFTFLVAVVMLAPFLWIVQGSAQEQEVELIVLPPALDRNNTPLPDNLHKYLNSTDGAVTPEAQLAAIRLGKSLFWDMQLGSDGIQTCASCHFHAGTDNRSKNSLNPGLLAGDTTFQTLPAVNETLGVGNFPFHLFFDRHDRFSLVVRDSNDIVGSQGVFLTDFRWVDEGSAVEPGTTAADTVFTRYARNVRRITGRNAPSVINAAFNFANFWDGRANHFFNGVNPFGYQDVNARVLVNNGGSLGLLNMMLPENQLNNASLASQSVGPLLSDVEMSWTDRTFPDIGRKMLSLIPLGKQTVHPNDSVLGPLAKSTVTPGAKGLDTTYGDLIRAAFQSRFWDSAELTGSGYTQMEANFSLFFGLSMMMYQATLISDDTPFDRYLRGDAAALTDRQVQGMNLFFSGVTSCSRCHMGSELTSASVAAAKNPLEPGLIEAMLMADGEGSVYDVGYYNVGSRPTGEDIARGGLDPFGQPLSFTQQFLQRDALPFSPIAQPGCIVDPLENPVCPPDPTAVTRAAVDGAFKTPSLRNIELTGPYMHNGGLLTLAQVVDFYTRGADFSDQNIDNLAPGIMFIPELAGETGALNREALIDFLLALTDDRVRWESAPFDHPQLFVPSGHSSILSRRDRFTMSDAMMEIPPVGADGRLVQGLPPLKPFLDGTGAAQDWDRTLHFKP